MATPRPSFVYAITHIPTGRVYIGKTVNPKRRWIEHRGGAKRGGKNGCTYLHAAIAKHGAASFSFKVLRECSSEEEAFEAEKSLIVGMKSIGAGGFNLATGGLGGTGDVLRGRKFSAEHRANISAARRGKKFGPLSEEHKRKISASQIGKYVSPETRAKASASHKGQKLSDQHKAKLSAIGRGRKHTPEHAAKISAALMGHVTPAEVREKIRATLKKRNQKP